MAEAGLDLFLENLPSLCCVGVAFLGISAIAIRKITNKDVVVEHNIRTNADAARATVRLHNKLKQAGLSDEDARELATHELSHALADREKHIAPRRMGFTKPGKNDTTVNAWYDNTVGSSAENNYRVATEPSRSGRSAIPMSDTDAAIAKAAKLQMKLNKTKG